MAHKFSGEIEKYDTSSLMKITKSYKAHHSTVCGGKLVKGSLCQIMFCWMPPQVDYTYRVLHKIDEKDVAFVVNIDWKYDRVKVFLNEKFVNVSFSYLRIIENDA